MIADAATDPDASADFDAGIRAIDPREARPELSAGMTRGRARRLAHWRVGLVARRTQSVFPLRVSRRHHHEHTKKGCQGGGSDSHGDDQITPR